MSSSKSGVSVGLPWHSLRDPNLGVGAFTVAHISMLKAAAAAANRSLSVRILDPVGGPAWTPPGDVAMDEVLYDLHTDLLPHSTMWRAVGDCDVILDIGAGELSSDVYGPEIFYFVFCSRMAALAQSKRVILSPQTFGPFKSEFAQSLMMQTVRRSERTFTRDGESFLFLKDMGIVEGIEESIDLAFRLPFHSRPRISSSSIRFGLNVSGLLYSEASLNRFSFGLRADYPSLINGIITTLMQRRDVSIVLVPHVVAEGSDQLLDDVWICQRLAKEFGLPMAPLFRSAVEAKSFISDLDILAGSRMHATIAALSSGVPVIPLGHTRKFTGIFSSVSYPVMCDLRSQDEEMALTCVHDAMDRLPELRAAAARSNAVAQSKLDAYQAYLNELILSLP
jgi:colanic acid/amylovoran biosynthesis protein